MAEVLLMRFRGGALLPADAVQADALGSMDPRGVLCVTITQERVHVAHRRLFALFGYLYDLWEPEAQTEDGVPVQMSRNAFQHNLTIAAGHFVQVFRPDGSFTLEPRSLAYDVMDQTEFDDLFSRVIDVAIRTMPALRGWDRERVEREVGKLIRGWC